MALIGTRRSGEWCEELADMFREADCLSNVHLRDCRDGMLELSEIRKDVQERERSDHDWKEGDCLLDILRQRRQSHTRGNKKMSDTLTKLVCK